MSRLGERGLFFAAGLAFGAGVGWLIASSEAPPAAPAPLSASAPEPGTVDAGRLEERMAVVRDAPEDPEARVRVAELYLESRQFGDAVHWLEQAHNLTPGDLDIRGRLAFARIGLGDVETATSEFETILAEDPDHADSLLAMGRLSLYLHQDIEAGIRYWERLVEVAPGTPAAAAVLEELEALKSAHP